MRIGITAIALSLGLGLLVAACATGPMTDSVSRSELADIAQGGLLYDKWYGVLEVDGPKTTHPVWAASGNKKKKGNTTWRCKSCHGWDFMGKDGAYASGSYKTGTTGIRAYAGGDAEKVEAILRGKTHGYTKAMLDDKSVHQLAAFVTKGQVDMDKYIDRGSRKAKGNAANGKVFFSTICSKCHGADGREINFADEPKLDFVATVSNKNPWEILNKIRNGHPGSQMPGLNMLSIMQQVDILTYAHTLPTSYRVRLKSNLAPVREGPASFI